MSYHPAQDFDDGDLSDRELPDRSDMDADIDDNSMPCPHCHRDIYEDSEFCPRCGKYISQDDTPMKLSSWLVIGVILTLMIVLFCWIL